MASWRRLRRSIQPLRPGGFLQQRSGWKSDPYGVVPRPFQALDVLCGFVVDALEISEGATSMLFGYLDASGTNRDQGFTAVAGWAMSERERDAWEVEWRIFLEEFGLLRWHHTDFYNNNNEYKRWNEEKKRAAEMAIIRIFKKFRLFGVGAAVKRSDYEELLAIQKWDMPSDPYEFCLDCCLEELIHKLHEAPKDDGILIHVDRDSRDRVRGGEARGNWHIDYLRQNDAADDRDRPVTVKYGADTEYIPLQVSRST
jgi:hypothetical protein